MRPGTLFVAAVLAACAPAPNGPAAPTDEAPPTQAPEARQGGVGLTGLAGTPVHLLRLHPGPARRAASPPRARFAPDPFDALLPRLSATLDLDAGAALVAALDDLPPDRRALGLDGLTLEALFDPEAGCQPPIARASFAHDGATWEIAVGFPQQSVLLGPPVLAEHTLSDACRAALLDAGRPTASDGCTEDDALSLYPTGSACRDCLDADGDFAACEAEGACVATAPLQQELRSGATGRLERHYVHRVTTLACAPDLRQELRLLSRDLPDGPLSFDHDLFEAMCFSTWTDDGPTWACNTAEFGAHVVSDAVYAFTDTLRPAGDEATFARHRSLLLAGIDLDADTLGASLLYHSGLATVSAPEDTPYGWGLHPYAPRPDPRDPAAPPAPRPQDWIAGLTMKTASEIDGIIVHAFQHNRCAADGWVDLGDGTSRCDDVGPYATLHDDGWISWYDLAAGTTVPFPYVTLASTGLPDPDAPGGLFTEIHGSTTLADPGWEACAWPDTFTPDRMPLVDSAPPTDAFPGPTFDAQTFRFGRPGDPGFVLALATSQRRGFCYDAPP